MLINRVIFIHIDINSYDPDDVGRSIESKISDNIYSYIGQFSVNGQMNLGLILNGTASYVSVFMINYFGNMRYYYRAGSTNSWFVKVF